MKCRIAILVMLLAVARSGSAATLPMPIAAEVYVKGVGKATALRGKLTSYDEVQFTLHVGADDRTLNWADVTPNSAYALRLKTVDRGKAQSWLDLGKFAWSIGLKDQAKQAFHSAVRIDAASQNDVDLTLATPAGALLATAATKPAGELMQAGGGTLSAPTAKPEKEKNPDAPTKFLPSTPEQAAAAMAASREEAAATEKQLSLQFAEFETDHFLIFTDWDPREYGFLKENLENAYRVVSKQFDMNPKDNVFVGKLPVYMMKTYGEFADFATKIDQFNTNLRLAGYYRGNNRGVGHMAMWKPDNSLTGTSDIHAAERLWAYVLVHEFTHAFLARYRTNEFVPRWLNEGIAEVIAASEFPYPDHARIAHMMAIENKDLSFLFDDANMPSGEYYPVMQSMAELLIRDNRGNFLKLIGAIKDGENPEAALERLYNTDYANLARTWREWARRN